MTMVFALYELALNPDIQDKLRDHIRSILSNHNNELTYETMLDMKYLQMVLDGKYFGRSFMQWIENIVKKKWIEKLLFW